MIKARMFEISFSLDTIMFSIGANAANELVESRKREASEYGNSGSTLQEAQLSQ